MRWRHLVLAAALALAGAACGGNGGRESVSVTLTEYSVTPSPATAPSGSVTFEATNAGTLDHELVVIRTGLDPAALPTEGADVDEDGEGIEVVGEIAEFSAGKVESATFTLSPGSYVLICNVPGHYSSGMRAAFEVT